MTVLFNPLMDVAGYIQHVTFISDARLQAMSLGLRLCASREDVARGGGWVHPKGADSMAVSWLGLEKLGGWNWVGHFSPLHK